MKIRNFDKELRDYSATARQIAGMIGLLTLFAILAFLYGYRQFTSSGAYRREYEGRVVEKKLVGGETQLGSKFTYRLLIRGKDNQSFEVIVGEQLYNRVEGGDWIKASRDGVEVSKTGIKENSGKGGGETK